LTVKTELLLVTNKPGISETGGGHGAKGVDFQRWWAVLRMVELAQSSEADFLLLFEAVQDVTELDSAHTPTRATVYQVKKKDSGTWSWSTLTGTVAPKKPSKITKATASQPTAPLTTPDFSKVSGSALGKLYLSLAAFDALPVEGYFVSNAGCEVPLASGGSAASSMPCTLADLAPEHAKQLTDALQSLNCAGTQTLDLTRVKLKKVAIHPDNLSAPAIASALNLLKTLSPEHAGQAAAFVESLVMKISALGRHTDTCSSFDELVRQRGFSKADFLSALSALESIPDHNALLNYWLAQLQSEGFDFRLITAMRMSAARVVRERLTGLSQEAQAIDNFCDNWANSNVCGSNLKPYLDAALSALKANFSGYRDEELLARFVMREITKCVDQN
jgi:hypothetical protein